jgi:GntR family transcriptional regulator
MTRATTYLPRYRAIEQTLRSRITVLRPGDRLPSDSDLCLEFGVSRMTARNAMQRLADEGLVLRDPGRGSFVAEAPAHRRADRLLSFSLEMQRQGRVPSSLLVSCELRAPRDAEASELRLGADESVVALRRVRIADAEPIAVETAVLPGRCASLVMAADLGRGSLHEALVAGGFVPWRGHAVIVAESATASDAQALRVNVGDPLLVERRVILDQHGVPLEATESRYPADRYALEVGFSVEERAIRPARSRPSRSRSIAVDRPAGVARVAGGRSR